MSLSWTAPPWSEFDTHTPHVIANQGDHPTEMLALFGPQGEIMQVPQR